MKKLKNMLSAGALTGLIAVIGVIAVARSPVVAAGSCETLASLVLPDTTITLAGNVAAGELSLPGVPPGATKDLPAFCRVAATLKPNTGGKVDRTRPLCPYPQTAQYKGAGSTDDAASFVCKAP